MNKIVEALFLIIEEYINLLKSIITENTSILNKSIIIFLIIISIFAIVVGITIAISFTIVFFMTIIKFINNLSISTIKSFTNFIKGG